MYKGGFGKTLFVSDLDGTLLTSKQTLSDNTKQTVNDLISKGISFTFATARSLTTAKEVTQGLDWKLPVIVYNGAFIQAYKSGDSVLASTFSAYEKEDILALHLFYDLHPRVYALHNGVERFSYEADKVSLGTREYLKKRRSDKRANATTHDRLLDGDVFCFSSIDDYEKMLPLYEILKQKYHAVLYQDPYTAYFWLEVLPKHATKADAVLELKTRFGFERVVVFGDEKNDLSMFAVADESYAVANANEDVKRAANGVIGSNDSDGVALYLNSLYEQYCQA